MKIFDRLICALPRKLGGGHQGELVGQGMYEWTKESCDWAGQLKIYHCLRCGLSYKVKLPKAEITP